MSNSINFYKMNVEGTAVIVDDGTRPAFELKSGDSIKLRYLFWGHSDKPNFNAVVGEDLEDFILAMNTEYKDYEVIKR